MQSTRIRYKEIDVLKGIAIVLVILGHAIISYPVNLRASYGWPLALYNWIYSFHMPLFFLVSGYCFSYHGDYRAYITKKAWRIALPFWVFNLLRIVPRTLFPIVTDRAHSFKEGVFQILFSGGGYWFLYVLFLIFLIFPYIYIYIYISGKKFRKWIVLFCVFILALLPLPNIFLIQKTVYHLFYFLLGFILRQYISVETAKAWVNTHRAAALGIMAFTALCWFIPPLSPLPHLTEAVPQNIPISLIGILFWCLFVLMVQNRVFQDIFADFGKYSLQLYLFGNFALGVSRLLSATVFHWTNPALLVIFNFLFDWIPPYLIIKYVVMRYKPLKVLCGITG